MVIGTASALKYSRVRLLGFTLLARAIRFTIIGLLVVKFGKEVTRVAKSEPFEWRMTIFIGLCVLATGSSLWKRLHSRSAPLNPEPMITLDRQPELLFLASKAFLWRVVLTAVITLLIIFASNVLLTMFLGILLAVVLRAAVDWVHRVSHLSLGWAYWGVLVIAVGIVAALGYGLGPRVLSQAHDLSNTVPKAMQTLRQQVTRYDWGQDLIRILNRSTQPAQVAASIRSSASSLVSGATMMIAMLAIALFLGANPDVYCRGVPRLFPEGARQKAGEVFQDMAFTLRWWLIGQLVPMAVLGIGTMVCLWLLGIPLAFTLGLLTAAMLFIPYVGSVIAYVPTALVALTQGPEKVIVVTVLYVGVHLAEGYVVTPCDPKPKNGASGSRVAR